jgi:PAS domain S-box-containing protein
MTSPATVPRRPASPAIHVENPGPGMSRGLLVKRALPFVLALGIAFSPVPAGLTAPAWHLFAVFVSAITAVLIGAFPLLTSTTIAVAAVVITGTISPAGEVPNTRIESRYVHKTGQVLWGDICRSLIRDSQTGKPRYIVTQTVDTTERKRIEEELRKRESELKEAQRLAQLGSWTWESVDNTTRWSDEMYRIHGLDPNLPPPQYKELSQLFTVESWEQLKTAISEAWQTGSLPNTDLELIRPDGSRHWISSRGEAERDGSGHKIRLRGTAQDITDRKRMEQTLRDTEERFRTIADSAPVLIWMSGPDRLRTYFNRSWLDFTGQSLEEELGA